MVGLRGWQEDVLEYMSIMDFLSLDSPLTAAADTHVKFTKQEAGGAPSRIKAFAGLFGHHVLQLDLTSTRGRTVTAELHSPSWHRNEQRIVGNSYRSHCGRLSVH